MTASHSSDLLCLTAPDGTSYEISYGMTCYQFAAKFSSDLCDIYKGHPSFGDIVLMQIDDVLLDLDAVIPYNGAFRFLTRHDSEALDVLRHDTAHIMAQAVSELYPGTAFAIGPAIENGFYYDFYPENPFTDDDLPKIEERMHDIVKRDTLFVRELWDKETALNYFKEKNDIFKVEIIENIPVDNVTIYKHQDAYGHPPFIDLCKGPHFPKTRYIGSAFKLMKLAGAYWRGDAKRPMLQRIYGTVWPDKKQLKEYLNFLEEAEKRDHRKLGKEMGLFHFQEEAPGAVFWHSKGWAIYTKLQEYIRFKLDQYDYCETQTPQLLDKSFWVQSGHWDKFRENMFFFQDHENTRALKPMSCPGAVQIFKQGIKSYRDLPLRLSEFGCCHRNEPSGSLHGLMRVRAMTQDDAHIFCTEEQIIEETEKFCRLLNEVYQEIGFAQPRVKFSDRPEKRSGSDAIWDKAETSLMKAVQSCGLEVEMNPGEGAFYGPKLEFVLKDAMGREWQLGTLQVDFILAERLDAYYITPDGQKQPPVILHRALFGSLERFIGVLIEHYAGKFPLWLNPVHCVITTITDDQIDYAQMIYTQAKSKGLKAILDTRNEKITYKIRDHSLKKIPYIFVVGNQEKNDHTVAIRKLGSKQSVSLSYAQALEDIFQESRPPYIQK